VTGFGGIFDASSVVTTDNKTFEVTLGASEQIEINNTNDDYLYTLLNVQDLAQNVNAESIVFEINSFEV